MSPSQIVPSKVLFHKSEGTTHYLEKQAIFDIYLTDYLLVSALGKGVNHG